MKVDSKFMELLHFVLEVGCGQKAESLGLTANQGNEEKGASSQSQFLSPLVMGELLRHHRISYVQPDHLISEYFSLLPLVKILGVVGEELIRAAAQTLPEEIKKLAQQWAQAKNPADQLAIIQAVCQFWRAPEQTPIDIISDGLESLRRFQEHTNESSDISRYLPRQFGQPDCLGRELQLTAFARLAGMTFHNSLVLSHLADLDRQLTLQLIKEVRHDMASRELFVPEAFSQSLDNHELGLHYLLEAEKRFHGCLVVRLIDGQWALMDPYGVVWGLLPPAMCHQMEWAHSMLLWYQRFLPGLTLPVVSDQPLGAHYLESARRWLKRSREAEQLLRTASSLNDLAGKIVTGGIIDDMLNGSTFAAIKDQARNNQQFKTELALDNCYHSATIIQMQAGYPSPSVLLKMVADSFITYYHLLALESMETFDVARQTGQVVHGAIEVAADSAFSLAVSVCNSVAVGHFGTLEFADLLAKLTFSQLFLRNVLGAFMIKREIAPQLQPSGLENYSLTLLENEKVKHRIVESTIRRLKGDECDE